MASAPRQLSVMNSIKCSTCGIAIPINELPTHLCGAAIIAPPLPAQNLGQYSNFYSPNQSPEKQSSQQQGTGYSQRWGKPAPPPKIDSAVANQSYISNSPFSASDRSDFSLRSGTPSTSSTNITTPVSYFFGGKLSRTPSPPTAGIRSNSTSPQKPLPSPGFANMGGPKSARPDFMLRADMAFSGPFGPKSPGLPPPSSSGWGNGPGQMRMMVRTPSPYGDLPQEPPAPWPNVSPAKKGPRLTAMDDFLNNMAQTPTYLKAEEFTFSTSTPHLSSGPGPAFTEDEPVSTFNYSRPEPPRKDTPKVEQKPNYSPARLPEPQTERAASPSSIVKKTGSVNARFNQFPPPKNMRKPSITRQPSTQTENNTYNYSPKQQPASISKPRINEPVRPFGMDPAVQMGLDEPFLRRSNSSPQDEPIMTKTQQPTEAYHTPSLSDPHNKSSNPHRSFPAGSGPPKHICRGCVRPIVGPSLKDSSGRLTGRYHRSCFTCTDCLAPFPTGDFYVLNNAPYCAAHYHARNGTCCKSCGDGIEGPYAETDDRGLWHRECFRCQDCGDLFNGPEYWEMEGRFVCGKHIGQTMRSEKRSTRFGMMGAGPGPHGAATNGMNNYGPPDTRLAPGPDPMQQGSGRPVMNGAPTGGQYGNRLAPPDPRSRWL